METGKVEYFEALWPRNRSRSHIIGWATAKLAWDDAKCGETMKDWPAVGRDYGPEQCCSPTAHHKRLALAKALPSNPSLCPSGFRGSNLVAIKVCASLTCVRVLHSYKWLQLCKPSASWVVHSATRLPHPLDSQPPGPKQGRPAAPFRCCRQPHPGGANSFTTPRLTRSIRRQARPNVSTKDWCHRPFILAKEEPRLGLNARVQGQRADPGEWSIIEHIRRSTKYVVEVSLLN